MATQGRPRMATQGRPRMATHGRPRMARGSSTDGHGRLWMARGPFEAVDGWRGADNREAAM